MLEDMHLKILMNRIVKMATTATALIVILSEIV